MEAASLIVGYFLIGEVYAMGRDIFLFVGAHMAAVQHTHEQPG